MSKRVMCFRGLWFPRPTNAQHTSQRRSIPWYIQHFPVLFPTTLQDDFGRKTITRSSHLRKLMPKQGAWLFSFQHKMVSNPPSRTGCLQSWCSAADELHFRKSLIQLSHVPRTSQGRVLASLSVSPGCNRGAGIPAPLTRPPSR